MQGKPREIVLFATGSPVLVEFEETLERANIEIALGVSNREGTSYLSDPTRLIASSSVERGILDLPFIIPLFTPTNRKVAADEAAALGFSRPYCLIDPTAVVPRTTDLGGGSYVNAGCVLGAKSRFGSFVFINRASSIGHHAMVGDFVSIGPGVTIGGQVSLGAGCMVGAGSTILPGIEIGEHAIVGAGSVVTRHVPPQAIAVGNPARVGTT